ncbi:MAG: hypothetical protein M3069_31200 [Chloroflexota bacterium]|nr:hypothetical protein [Chloroflexota bacterium]
MAERSQRSRKLSGGAAMLDSRSRLAVELAPLLEPALVLQAVSAVLTVREGGDRPLVETLLAAVRDRSILLVLDNREHLIDACASLSEALVRGCPGLRLRLATSREPLQIPGEATWRVAGRTS